MRFLVWSVCCVTALVVVGCGDVTSQRPTHHAPGCPGARAGTGKLGDFAYVDRGDIRVVDLGTCRTRTLARGAAPVHFSPDGRWVAFGGGGVVRTSGGQVLHPLGSVSDWAWDTECPRAKRCGDAPTLVGVSRDGSVLFSSPTGSPERVILRPQFGAGAVAISSTGMLAVSRTVVTGDTRRSEIWIVDPRLDSRRLAFRQSGGATILLAGWSPDGDHVLFWLDPLGSSSLAADGLSLHAVGLVGRRAYVVRKVMLPRLDYLSSCGSQIITSSGRDRYSTTTKYLVEGGLHHPTRVIERALRLSWVTPTCSHNGQVIAAAAGPSRVEKFFGEENRRIYVISHRNADRITNESGPEITDELPRLSRSGRTVLFVRTGPEVRAGEGLDSPGSLYIASFDGRWRVLGRIARLGLAQNYYGTYSWSSQTDWYEPTVRR